MGPALALVMCVSACGGSTKTVTVTVAPSPPKAVAVPFVVGLQEALALRKLTRSGLRGHARRKRNATVRAGLVFQQAPSAGVRVSRGSTVMLLASAGSSG
jgi:beta-lactam-binding protein with PASTA domain